MSERELAVYIFEWLRRRNGAELEDALLDMTLRSRETALDELERILTFRSKPPNWVSEGGPAPVDHPKS